LAKQLSIATAYIAFTLFSGILSNVEMISRTQEDVHGFCAVTGISYKELERPWVLVSAGGFWNQCPTYAREELHSK
jgi:hypothetical protein